MFGNSRLKAGLKTLNNLDYRVLNIKGKGKDFDRIPMIQVLCTHTKFGLKVSKDYADKILEGEDISIPLDKSTKVEALVKDLERIGLIVEVAE